MPAAALLRACSRMAAEHARMRWRAAGLLQAQDHGRLMLTPWPPRWTSSPVRACDSTNLRAPPSMWPIVPVYARVRRDGGRGRNDDDKGGDGTRDLDGVKELRRDRACGHPAVLICGPSQAARTFVPTASMTAGSYVYDINGNKYLDSLAGLWCTALGGSEPRLVKAATEQLNKLPFYHSFWNRTTKPSLELAEEILSMFTARKMGKVFFTNSGSEANDSQVKLVWYYNNALGRPNKKKFIARSKAYHGSTLISASLTGLPALHQKFDLPAPFVLHTDCPHYWRFHLPGETEEEFATRLANNLENLILKEGPETIAAFIAEPVMGAGGVIPPPKTYFDKVQAVVKKYDILFIADEVITAFGRLGTMFGSDMFNIKPDLVSLAKALSNAYVPIGATLVSPEIADVIHSQSNKLGSFAHGFTYSGHPVACAVAIEALKIYRERDIPGHVRKIAPKFQDGIRVFADSPIIGEIRGLGMILGTEFTNNKSPNDPFPVEWGVGTIFGQECQKRGMLVRVAGDAIMMSPTLIMTPGEVDELVGIYGEALKATEERVAELISRQK